MPSSTPLPLLVHPVLHSGEVARFFGHVLKGPGDGDCWYWMGPPRDDGYGQFSIRRDGVERTVRAHRYALATVTEGPLLDLGLHTCNTTICVRAEAGVRQPLSHVLAGTQNENMEQMARQRRGGGPWWGRRFQGTDRRSLVLRAQAIQAACAHGWDAEAIAEAKTRHPADGQQLLW